MKGQEGANQYGIPNEKNFFENVRSGGFTLIELLVVVAIISLLSSIVFASLNSARLKARDAQRKQQLKQLALVNELYFDAEGNGTYVGLTGWLSNTVQYGGGNNAFNAVIPKYIGSLPNDPLYPARGYIYLTKDWVISGSYSCDVLPPVESSKYAFYAILESPSASDLTTISDDFDKCIKKNWGMNYRVGN